MSGPDKDYGDQQHEELDELARELAEASPRAEFPATEIRQRIAQSVGGDLSPRSGAAVPHGMTPPPRAGRWLLQAAAAVLLFAGGVTVGRWNPSTPQPASDDLVVATTARSTTSRALTQLEPRSVPLSIQQAGTSYVSSLALFSEMNAQLTPEQRRQAREVALAVLSGAVAELLVSAEDGGVNGGGEALGAGDELQLSDELLDLLRVRARSETQDVR